MRIKKIKKLSSNKYNIEFTNGDNLITYDKIILENNVLLKSEIDSVLYQQMLEANDYYEIYNKAVRYIMIRLRSRQEIISYINQYTDDINKIEKIVKQLEDERLLNDTRYIHAFIEDKVNLTNFGPNKIRKQLENLGFNQQEVESTLSGYEEEIFLNKAKNLIDKKLRMNHKDSVYIVKQKIERDLFDLGYDREMVLQLLVDVSIDESIAAKVEAEKLCKKLRAKYSGNELLYQVKQKLYKKGFTADTIHAILEDICAI